MTARCPRCSAALGAGGVCGPCLIGGGSDDDPVRLGPLELEEPIGEGGMGQVYRARHARLGRTVAVKLLPPDLAASDEFRRRFEREAQALARLSHPGIVTVHDFCEEDGQYYLVMEYAEGGTLASRMPMPTARAVRFGVELAEALAYAHAHGIVHRDIKPANVLLQDASPDGGRAKLTDFGVARFIGPHSGGWTVTQPDRIAGTPHYMAPEVIDGAPPDPKQDQYALGVLLYEMVTGTRPIGDFAPLDGPLDAVVRRLLAPDPARRYASASELADVLRALLPASAPSSPAAVRAGGAATRPPLETVQTPLPAKAGAPADDALPDDEAVWLQGAAVVLTVCTAVAIWAVVLCLTPRVIPPGEALPLVMIDEAARLPDGRIVSYARFEIGPLLAAFVAVGLGLVAQGFLERHWRRAGLWRAVPGAPVPLARRVLGLGVLASMMYATRRTFEAFGYIGLFRYIPVIGGLLEVFIVFTVWSALLEARRRRRPILFEWSLWLGVALALVPPTTDFTRFVARWHP